MFVKIIDRPDGEQTILNISTISYIERGNGFYTVNTLGDGMFTINEQEFAELVIHLNNYNNNIKPPILL